MKVCSAYGAGFFFIPGTDTCLKIGGRVRADYAYVPANDTYSALGTTATASVASSNAPVLKSAADSQHTNGTEARGVVTFDARTATAWGTVQTAASFQMSRTSGILNSADKIFDKESKPTLVYGYVRFAGFTFGASRDNFAFMPSLTYGAGHWGSFANGAKQLAYTATFGGGVSATIALQDYSDTASEKSVAQGGGAAAFYNYNSMPQVNANIRVDQSWGALQLMGAYADVSVNTAADAYDKNKGVYAIGAGAKINLPMLAKGDALYLIAAYANGMTEYTTNWTSGKGSAYSRDVGGFTFNHPSLVTETAGLETVKSWAIGALLEHYWAPQYRSVVFGTYGQLDAPASAKARNWNGTTGFGDASTWNVGTNFAWLPTRGFEIGVEVIYARVNHDVRGFDAGVAAGDQANQTSSIYRRSDSNVTGRLRVERTF